MFGFFTLSTLKNYSVNIIKKFAIFIPDLWLRKTQITLFAFCEHQILCNIYVLVTLDQGDRLSKQEKCE